jgi:hypothetical protein
MSQIGTTHAIPVTVDEFGLAQRHFPIVFSIGDNPIPIALMGLNEGINVFLDENGRAIEADIYIPAYIRRYPFMLARLRPDSDELSLCFDTTADAVGEFDEGEPLFVDGGPSDSCKGTLQFCEQFEIAGQKTANFMAELQKHNLLMDGELNIDIGTGQPYNYRGFRMVDENKLRDVRGDILRTWNQSGLLALIYAHLFSLDQVRDIFGRQVAQGKGPQLPQAA